ncbi:coiled-coil domain-containing protein [Aeromonas media]|uniref:coiled-coil domain-containing protein n=1 Tax=Aeromonas media TaxID=651 RepID=UPI003D2612A4
MSDFSFGDGLPDVLTANGGHEMLQSYLDNNSMIFDIVRKILPIEKKKTIKKRLSLKERVKSELIELMSIYSIRKKINFFLNETNDYSRSLEVFIMMSAMGALGLTPKEMENPVVELSEKYIWLNYIVSEADVENSSYIDFHWIFNSLESVFEFIDDKTKSDKKLTDSEYDLVALSIFAFSSWNDSILPVLALIEKDNEFISRFSFIEGPIERARKTIDFSGLGGVSDLDFKRVTDKYIIESSVEDLLGNINGDKSKSLGDILFMLETSGNIAPIYSRKLLEIHKKDACGLANHGIGEIVSFYEAHKSVLEEPLRNQKIDPFLAFKKSEVSKLIGGISNFHEMEAAINYTGREYLFIYDNLKELSRIKDELTSISEKKKDLMAKSEDGFPDMDKMNSLYSSYLELSQSFIKEATNLYLKTYSIDKFEEKLCEAKERHQKNVDEKNNFISNMSRQLGVDDVVLTTSSAHSDEDKKEVSPKNEGNEDIVLLKEELQTVYQHCDELESQIKEIEEKLRNEVQKNIVLSDANSRLKSSQASSDALGSEEAEALRTILISPSDATPEMILAAYGVLYRDRLVVLPGAFRSAAGSSTFRQSARLSRLIGTLVTEYLDAIKGGQPDAQAKAMFGGAYSAKESETVMGNPELRSYREFEVNGEKTLMLQHLTIGVSNSASDTIRIYFKIIDGVIYIGYCGEHLPLRQS